MLMLSKVGKSNLAVHAGGGKPLLIKQGGLSHHYLVLCPQLKQGLLALLVQHRGAVYRIAKPPGSSELLLSGGEDGQVPPSRFYYCSQFKTKCQVEKQIHQSIFRSSSMIFGFLILPSCWP